MPLLRLTGDTSHHKRGDRQCLINLLAKKGFLLAASLVVMLTLVSLLWKCLIPALAGIFLPAGMRKPAERRVGGFGGLAECVAHGISHNPRCLAAVLIAVAKAGRLARLDALTGE